MNIDVKMSTNPEMILGQVQMRILDDMKVIQEELCGLPAGELKLYNGQKGPNCYYYENGHRTYLKKEEMDNVGRMARSTFLKLRYEEMNEKLTAIERCIDEMKSTDSQANCYYLKNDEIRKLLDDYEKPDKWNQWMQKPYDRCPLYPEGLIYSTVKGDKVRSKSEVIIADALFEAKVPYIYEPAYIMGGETYYPDFFAADRKRNRVIIIECLGLMDDGVYEAKNKKKIKAYIDNGWVPGDNIMLLIEKNGQPFDVQWVWDNIRYYLL